MEENGFELTLHDTSILKGIAICAMLWHHLFLLHPDYGNVVYHLALLGKVCVAIFLLLSGYGLTIQMNKLLDRAHGAIRGANLSLLIETIHKVLSQLLGNLSHIRTARCLLF